MSIGEAPKANDGAGDGGSRPTVNTVGDSDGDGGRPALPVGSSTGGCACVGGNTVSDVGYNVGSNVADAVPEKVGAGVADGNGDRVCWLVKAVGD